MRRLKIKLKNIPEELELDEKNPEPLFEKMISDIFIPKYTETDDFNLSINIILEEINAAIRHHGLKPKLKLGLLEALEGHLDKDIEELTGVAKIEILFLNMDDYIEDIKRLILSGKDKVEIRTDMANLAASLTLFELSELFIHLAREAFLK